MVEALLAKSSPQWVSACFSRNCETYTLINWDTTYTQAFLKLFKISSSEYFLFSRHIPVSVCLLSFYAAGALYSFSLLCALSLQGCRTATLPLMQVRLTASSCSDTRAFFDDLAREMITGQSTMEKFLDQATLVPVSFAIPVTSIVFVNYHAISCINGWSPRFLFSEFELLYRSWRWEATGYRNLSCPLNLSIYYRFWGLRWVQCEKYAPFT